MIGALVVVLGFYAVVCLVGGVLLVLWDRYTRNRDPLERIWRLPAAEVEMRGRRP